MDLDFLKILKVLTNQKFQNGLFFVKFFRRQKQADLIFRDFSTINFTVRRKITHLNAFLKRAGLLFSNTTAENRKLFKFQEMYLRLRWGAVVEMRYNLEMKEFTDIRKMLEEHLAAINDNTSEVQALFDYLQELEIKMEKMSQRLDQTQLSLGIPKPKITISPLNHLERKVFLILYTGESLMTYQEIADKAELSISIIPECISSLIQKGVPFRRSFFENQLFVGLEPGFKELQAKENIVNLSLQSFME